MLRRVALVLVPAVVVLALASPASAHVSVSPAEAPAGGFAQLVFSVPDELDSASTTQVQVVFPSDHPIADASVEPVPGWSFQVQKLAVTAPIKTDTGSSTQAVQSVTWTGGTIRPGEFQRFVVSVGLPANPGSLEFKALQTYSDGTVVRWIDSTPNGGPEPDHPAPVLTLTKAAGDTHATSTASSHSSSDDSTARTLGIIAIVVGALGVIVGGVALAARKRPAA
jgi:uncharacterized protein YcnI